MPITPPTLALNIRLRTCAELYACYAERHLVALMLEAAEELEGRARAEAAAASRVEPDGRPQPGSDVSHLPPAGEWTEYRRALAASVPCSLPEKQAPAESVTDFPQVLLARALGFTRWIAGHPDVGDSATLADREARFKREARLVLAGGAPGWEGRAGAMLQAAAEIDGLARSPSPPCEHLHFSRLGPETDADRWCVTCGSLGRRSMTLEAPILPVDAAGYFWSPPSNAIGARR